MTASTLRQIRTELADALVDEITAYSKLPAAPIPPFAVVMWPDTVSFAETLAGRSRYRIPITVYVSLVDVDTAQDQLDGYVSGGIRAAIERHPTTVWLNVIVETASNFRPESIGDTHCLAVDLNTLLIA